MNRAVKADQGFCFRGKKQDSAGCCLENLNFELL